ncbi:MAG: hypothetical protein KC777_07015 [Cyanobacteria bacterium HKST-UBA02]|nr:hypothetical protein [Cyanobacteria bacterium HKST-UBA02]
MKVSRFLAYSKLALAGLALACLAQPAPAQQYHYNYGNGRVINQGQIGLNQHESTYVPTGAINNTAKGIITGGIGREANPLLPGVKWGRTVGTSGDNFYMGGAPDKKGQVYRQSKKALQQRQMMQAQRQEQRRLQGGEVYFPGQNASSGGITRSGGTYSYGNSAGGAASYADVSTPVFNGSGSNNNNSNGNSNGN